MAVHNTAGALGSLTTQQDTLQIYQATASKDAFMTFHVSGDYAVHFGLDGTTNDLFVGGWSMGAVKHKVYHAGNLPTYPTVNNATLTLATSGVGLSGSDTFTSNQSSNTTFTVSSNATSANTASTIVSRDASKNFIANDITTNKVLVGNGSATMEYNATTESIDFIFA